MSDQLLWQYNLHDVSNTLENHLVLREHTKQNGKELQVENELKIFPLALRAMIRGVRVDLPLKRRLEEQLRVSCETQESYLHKILGDQINFSSPQQLMRLFYHDLGLPPVRDKKTGNISASDAALGYASRKDPILHLIADKIAKLRSSYVFKRTFASAILDPDDRIRCSFNPAGTSTFRFSSSKSCWGTGFNFQNVPKGDEDFPNIRNMFIPDDGMVFFDGDLSRADVYVVAAESKEPVLMEALNRGVDLHLLNAYILQNRGIPDMSELIENNSDIYLSHRSKMKKQRTFAKYWCHGTNYGGSPRTMAASAGITVAESELATKTYFGFYKGLKTWHQVTLDKLQNSQPIINPYGFSTKFFGDPSRDLSEALAWVPQSTVGLHINRIWLALSRAFSHEGLEILIQVHDSLAGQLPKGNDVLVKRMETLANNLPIPYEHLPDGLNIPWHPKLGNSWGEACE